MEPNNQSENQKAEIHISQKTIINLSLSLLGALFIFCFIFLAGYEVEDSSGLYVASQDHHYEGILVKDPVDCYNYIKEYTDILGNKRYEGERRCDITVVFGKVFIKSFYIMIFLWAIFFAILRFREKYNIKVIN